MPTANRFDQLAFLADGRFALLGPTAQVLYLRLHALMQRDGVLPSDPLRLKRLVGWASQTIRKGLEELAADGWIREAGDVLEVQDPSWITHEKVSRNSEETPKKLPRNSEVSDRKSNEISTGSKIGDSAGLVSPPTPPSSREICTSTPLPPSGGSNGADELDAELNAVLADVLAGAKARTLSRLEVAAAGHGASPAGPAPAAPAKPGRRGKDRLAAFRAVAGSSDSESNFRALLDGYPRKAPDGHVIHRGTTTELRRIWEDTLAANPDVSPRELKCAVWALLAEQEKAEVPWRYMLDTAIGPKKQPWRDFLEAGRAIIAQHDSILQEAQ